MNLAVRKILRIIGSNRETKIGEVVGNHGFRAESHFRLNVFAAADHLTFGNDGSENFAILIIKILTSRFGCAFSFALTSPKLVLRRMPFWSSSHQ
jgi:hypothetical protein